MKHFIKSSLTALFVLATLPAQAKIIATMDANGQICHVDTNQEANSNGRVNGVSDTMDTVNLTLFPGLTFWTIRVLDCHQQNYKANNMTDENITQ